MYREVENSMNVTSCESWIIFEGSELIAQIVLETRERKLVKAWSKLGPLAWRSLITNFTSVRFAPRVKWGSASGNDIASNGPSPATVPMPSLMSSAVESFALSSCTIWCLTNAEIQAR